MVSKSVVRAESKTGDIKATEGRKHSADGQKLALGKGEGGPENPSTPAQIDSAANCT